MVLISVAVQEIHCGTYVVSHVVGHDAPWLHQANGVPAPPEGPILRTKCLGELVLDFRMFLINFSILEYCHIICHVAVCNLQSLN